MEEKYCPCCGRHCSLEMPSCERGVRFAETGIAVSDDRHKEHSGKEHCERAHRKDYQTLDVDGKLICNIRDMGHLIRGMSDGKAGQSRILIMLGECKKITQSELTERLGVQSGTVSEVIGKLERAGLVTRTENENDKRTCELSLTEEGAARAAVVGSEREERYGEMFACLSDEEKNELLSLLEKVNSHWRDHFGYAENNDRRHGCRHGRGHCCHGENGERRHGHHHHSD